MRKKSAWDLTFMFEMCETRVRRLWFVTAILATQTFDSIKRQPKFWFWPCFILFWLQPATRNLHILTPSDTDIPKEKKTWYCSRSNENKNGMHLTTPSLSFRNSILTFMRNFTFSSSSDGKKWRGMKFVQKWQEKMSTVFCGAICFHLFFRYLS